MAKSKKEKKTKKQLTINKVQLLINDTDEDSLNQQFNKSTIVLMPELEELVKKNPNRLIGCGG